MNSIKFFTEIKSNLFHGAILQIQVDSINAILNSCSKHGVTVPEQIAYILATAYHEARFKPVEEIGKGAGYDYGKKLDMGSGSGHRVPYTTPDKLFYGRGLIQLTWLCNYKAFGRLLNIDLVNHPELALSTPVAAEIIVVGMKDGMFTGKSLTTYFNGVTKDPISARRVVNGNDKAQLIAGYYGVFLHALQP